MTIEIIDCEQGTPEWFTARRGVPSASMFKAILAKGEGKVRRDYMLRLAAELLTGENVETYFNADMQRGKDQEDQARRLYAMLYDKEPRRVGFITNDEAVRGATIGCSPDSLIDEDGGLEI